jgi:hypothetical protein
MIHCFALNTGMKKKFLKLCNEMYERHTRGGFLYGDYVKFKDDATSHEEYKALSDNIKELISDMQKSGLHIRVVGINDLDNTRYPGNSGTSNGKVVLNIALDNGGGRYTHHCTVPSCCLAPITDFYPNVAPPLSDKLVRPNGTIITPVEYKLDKDMAETISQTRKSQQGKNVQDTELELPKKQVKIPASSAKEPKVAKPEKLKESFDTSVYMVGI